jgi:hypothetical protein
MTTNITIHEGIATLESGRQSRAIAFLSTVCETYLLEILEAARIALQDESVLDEMDMGDEHAALILSEIEEFMK